MKTTVNHDQHGWFTSAHIGSHKDGPVVTLEPMGDGTVALNLADGPTDIDVILDPDHLDDIISGLVRARAALRLDARRRSEVQARHRELAAQRVQS